MLDQSSLARSYGATNMQHMCNTWYPLETGNGRQCSPHSLVVITRAAQDQHSSQHIQVLDIEGVLDTSQAIVTMEGQNGLLHCVKKAPGSSTS